MQVIVKTVRNGKEEKYCIESVFSITSRDINSVNVNFFKNNCVHTQVIYLNGYTDLIVR